MSHQQDRASHRVLIIEYHALFAESLELSLSMEGYDASRLRLAEVRETLAAIRSAALRRRPRTVLLDLDLGPLGDAGGLVGPLSGAGVNVLVVTGSDDRAQWGACVQQGARKVLSKSTPLSDVLATVHRLHDGLPVMTQDEAEGHLRAWREQAESTRVHRRQLDSLTPRESEVLALLMEGMTVREIARASVVSEATVRTQVKSILAKLDVSSQLAAVGLAHRSGWSGPTISPAPSVPHLGHARRRQRS